jgi:predicted nucleic acid-binding protein
MATATADPVFVDTNILIYAKSAGSPLHGVAVTRLDELEAAGTELWVSRQILREFVAGMTRPGVANPMPPLADVLADARRFESRFRVGEDGPLITAEWLQLLAAVPCGGKQVHDANIVATMLVHGIPNLLTHNVADFQRFAAYITVLPLVP